MYCELYSISFPNGKQYIGISSNSRRRLRQHISSANRGKTGPKLYSAIRKYGEASLSLRVLCIGDHDYIKNLEILAIAAYGTRDDLHGYNVSLGGDHFRLGCRNPPEAIAKSRKANTGRKNTPETIERMRQAALNRAPMTEETGRKISEAKRGSKHSAEALAKMSKAQQGRKHSAETRAKISAAQIGRSRPPEVIAKMRSRLQTPATRAKVSAALTGRQASDKTRARMSEVRKGRPKSPDHIAKIKAALIKHHRGDK